MKIYGEVLREYDFHPELRCADANGVASNKQTVGLLQRRRVLIDHIRYIGKESNLLEDVEAGLIHSEQAAYTEYPDPRRDEWETKIRPALRKASISFVMKEAGLSRRMLIDARTGRRRPYPKNQILLASVLGLTDYL